MVSSWLDLLYSDVHEFIKDIYIICFAKRYLRFMQADVLYMQRALQLSLLGKGTVAPNPMVGAVIVHDDQIIGEGYHEKFGEAHAEVNAINSVSDSSLLKESTIYVTLEPCAHHGKTPPCADLIVEKQFKRVVIGALDSHSKVDGKGRGIIERNGIPTECGILEEEIRKVNKHFFTYHEKKRPFVFLKWAQTPNGLIDNDGQQAWISSPEIKPIVHQWRNEHQAILVGKNTVLKDDPELTVREVKGSNPTRVLIDPDLSVPHSKRIFNDDAETIIFNNLQNETRGTNTYIQLEDLSIHNILDQLYQLNIISLMVEGGAFTANQFIQSGLWDEAKVIIGANTFEKGTKAPVLDIIPLSEEVLFGNQIQTFVKS